MTEPDPDADLPACDPAVVLAALRAGHVVALGIRYVDHGSNWCALALDYDRRLVSDWKSGILASGPIVSLIDSAAGMAVMLRRDCLVAGSTLDLRVDYLRPARPGAAVTARAECYRLTRRIAFVRALAHDGDAADPIAHAAGTFALSEATA